MDKMSPEVAEFMGRQEALMFKCPVCGGPSRYRVPSNANELCCSEEHAQQHEYGIREAAAELEEKQRREEFEARGKAQWAAAQADAIPLPPPPGTQYTQDRGEDYMGEDDEEEVEAAPRRLVHFCEKTKEKVVRFGVIQDPAAPGLELVLLCTKCKQVVCVETQMFFRPPAEAEEHEWRLE